MKAESEKVIAVSGRIICARSIVAFRELWKLVKARVKRFSCDAKIVSKLNENGLSDAFIRFRSTGYASVNEAKPSMSTNSTTLLSVTCTGINSLACTSSRCLALERLYDDLRGTNYTLLGILFFW